MKFGFFYIFALILIGSIAYKHFSEAPFIDYSEGERIGVLRKFSKKGLIYKTWEGELMLNAGMGTVKLDTFNFSCPNKDVASFLKDNLGQEIILTYKQGLLMPYKLGSTSYLITSANLK